MSMRAAFTRVYKTAEWANGSGPGSGEHETSVWREFLRRYMRRNRVTSVLDLGCGDWQSTRLIDWTGIDYLGIDIVPQVIEACQERYAVRRESLDGPGIRFQCADILKCQLPPADLIVCKEVLQHWPNEAIARFRKRTAWRRVLLVNDWAPWRRNPDITAGGYRPLNLAAAPFGWPVREVLQYTLAYKDGTREAKLGVEL